jgi:hypothetical protein
MLPREELALTSPTSGGRSVGIIRSQTKATELVKKPTAHMLERRLGTFHVNLLTGLLARSQYAAGADYLSTDHLCFPLSVGKL